jgi:hypothetical protein
MSSNVPGSSLGFSSCSESCWRRALPAADIVGSADVSEQFGGMSKHEGYGVLRSYRFFVVCLTNEALMTARGCAGETAEAQRKAAAADLHSGRQDFVATRYFTSS